MVVIFSFALDAHALAVQIDLRRRGVCSLCIFVDRLPQSGVLEVRPDGGRSTGVLSAILEEATRAPYSLWWRRPNFLEGCLPVTDKGNFARREWKALVHGAGYLLERRAVRTLNPIAATASAANKVAQLAEARDLGFAIPATVMASARSALSAPDLTDRICKTFTPYCLEGDDGWRVLYARAVSDEDLARLPAVSTAPLIVQQRLRKRCELRSFVLGDAAVSVKIASDYEQTGSIDWREHTANPGLMTPTNLPQTTLGSCRALLSRFGIHGASFDFVVDADGGMVFLEFNEQGNFLFLDEVSGIATATRMVANFLADGIAGDDPAPAPFDWVMLKDAMTEILRCERDRPADGYRLLSP